MCTVVFPAVNRRISLNLSAWACFGCRYYHFEAILRNPQSLNIFGLMESLIVDGRSNETREE